MGQSFSVLSLVWCLVVWSFGLVGCVAARRRYRLRPRSPLATSPSAPGVSILRPLKGLDSNLYECLESSFAQEYPNFEIIFSVADGDDQALPVVRDLISKYPHVKATVIVGEEVVGANPKINNLVHSYRQAENDIIWVLDSNVKTQPGTLARSVGALTAPKVALVNHIPFGFSGKGGRLGSRMEEAYLNSLAKIHIAINTLALGSCAIGKSNLWRRSDIERLNSSPASDSPTPGLSAFGRYLAEDYALSNALWQSGFRYELSCDVAYNAVGNMSFSGHVSRRVRWIRVRKHVILATLLEPFAESITVAILACSSFKYLFSIPPWITCPLHFIFWILLDLDVYVSITGHPLPASSRWKFIVAWVARELLAVPIWILGMSGNEINWRGTRLRVLHNGEGRTSKTLKLS